MPAAGVAIAISAQFLILHIQQAFCLFLTVELTLKQRGKNPLVRKNKV
ncbi:hypothetical protein [Nostoc sp.]